MKADERNHTAFIRGFADALGIAQERADEVQAAFQWGFVMPDGHSADGIGQCRNKAEFERRAANGQIKVLS